MLGDASINARGSREAQGRLDRVRLRRISPALANELGVLTRVRLLCRAGERSRPLMLFL